MMFNFSENLMTILIGLLVAILTLYFLRRLRLIGWKGVSHEASKIVSEAKIYPKHDLDSVIENLRKASYPASLGSLNILFYGIIKNWNATNFYYHPANIFLWAAILFFGVSLFIGLTYQPVNAPIDNELKQKQAFFIVLLYTLALGLDLLGVMFIAVMPVA